MKLALIGNWGHHVCVLEEADAMPDVTVVGIAPGFDGEDLTSLQEKYSNAKTYDNHNEMLSSEQLDVVIISTRLDRISLLAVDAANAGCHSICEKPLALTHDSLKTLWEAVVKNKTQCIAMLPSRSNPVLAAAKQAVESGRIGDVKLLNARKSYKLGNQSDGGWLSKRSSYGGTIPWIGIHALDFINAICDIPFSSVSAMHANLAHPNIPEREDVCVLNLKLANGAMATASIDYLRPQSATTHGDDWLRIVGSKGIIEAAMDRGQCSIIDINSCTETADFDSRQPYYVPLMRTFPKAGTAIPTAETCRSFNLTHVALCARDAADTGTIVNDLNGPWNKNKKQVCEHER